MGNARVQAVEAYVKSMKTGEYSASAEASKHLAPDVVLSTGREEVKGHDNVLKRITGIWPSTPTLIFGAWSAPQQEGDNLKVHVEMPPLGAAPKEINLKFAFNGADQISRVDQETIAPAAPPATDTIPEFVKGVVDSALANGTPMVVAYVDENGQPVQSLRGSTQVYSDHQLSIWLRNPQSGIEKAIQKNPRLSLLYRDSKLRTTIIFQGQGRVENDPEVRNRVFATIPEVEQNHVPDMKGLVLLIDVDRVQGGGPRGPFRMERN